MHTGSVAGAFTESWTSPGPRLATDPVACEVDDRRDYAVERRKVIATAGAVTATAVAAVIAAGANFGIFGLAQQDSNVGNFPVVETRDTTAVPATTERRPVGTDDRSEHDAHEEPGDHSREEPELRDEDD